MRVRDQTKTAHCVKTIQSLQGVSRCRNAGTTVHMTSFFLNQFRRAVEERALMDERTYLITRSKFSLDTYSDEQCLINYRFKKREIRKLRDLFPWPENRNCTHRRRYRTNFIFSFCLACRRLCTVCRWNELETEFFMSKAALNEIFYEFVEHMHDTLGDRICNFRDGLMSSRADLYRTVIENSGAPLDRCVGFIDATNVYVARPSGIAQRATFNGHKRRNAVKMQSVTTPDGLIFNVGGPIEGRRHDMTLFRLSNIEEDLARALLINGQQHYIYGDSAYVLRAYLQVPFQGSALTDDQISFNAAMSKVRVSVEWGYKDIKQYFTHLDMPRKLCLKKTPAAMLYICAALLWNIRVCFYGCQTSHFFECTPPSLEEYLNMHVN